MKCIRGICSQTQTQTHTHTHTFITYRWKFAQYSVYHYNVILRVYIPILGTYIYII